VARFYTHFSWRKSEGGALGKFKASLVCFTVSAQFHMCIVLQKMPEGYILSCTLLSIFHIRSVL